MTHEWISEGGLYHKNRDQNQQKKGAGEVGGRESIEEKNTT